jgi:hypothetical protein
LALSFFLDDQEVREAIRKAKDWLIENQNEDGGWSIWKYEDSLVSATSWTLLALRQVVDLFSDDEKAKLSILNRAIWLKLTQNESNGCRGFLPNGGLSASETNNASTRMTIHALFSLGEDLEDYLSALKSFLVEFETESRWRTITESYTLKYFGEGLDQRISWFNAPFMVICLLLMLNVYRVALK